MTYFNIPGLSAENRAFLEKVSSPATVDFEFPDLDRDVLSAHVQNLLKRLTYRERTVLELRFGLAGEGYCYTLEETARIFKVTRERVRQMECRAIKKLRELDLKFRTDE